MARNPSPSFFLVFLVSFLEERSPLLPSPPPPSLSLSLSLSYMTTAGLAALVLL
jgi:hypothetical protein